jgi:membrane fusion protein (multidrug efflux system)
MSRSTFTHRAALAALLTAPLVFAACAAVDARPVQDGDHAEHADTTAPAPAAPAARPGVDVEVAIARAERVAREVSATGHLEAVHSIDVRPEVEGRIVQILVREGATVTAGTPLFKIDDAELRAHVARATADRDLARQTFERSRQLLAEQAASRSDLERAEAMARAADAQLELLTLRLERTTVRAPFAGLVGQRRVSLGDNVTPATPLVGLQTSNPQRVVLNIPERHAGELRAGQAVSFSVAAYPGVTFTATVDFVDPVVSASARSITVKALAPNPRGRLRPGMFAEARVATSGRIAAIMIPEQALMPAVGGGNSVWVVEENSAALRQVQLGARRAGAVEVTSGVAVGEQVVIGGVMQLSPGAPLSPRVIAGSR